MSDNGIRIKFMEEFLKHGFIRCEKGAEKIFGCSRSVFVDFINEKVRNKEWCIKLTAIPKTAKGAGSVLTYALYPPAKYYKYIYKYKIEKWDDVYKKIFINDDGHPTLVDRDTIEIEKSYVNKVYEALSINDKDDELEKIFIYAYILINTFNHGLDIEKAYNDLGMSFIVEKSLNCTYELMKSTN